MPLNIIQRERDAVPLIIEEIPELVIDWNINWTLPGKKAPGYHIADIAKGELGEISKIKEEFEEFIDADAQSCKIMALVELADMLGAIGAYLDRHHPGMVVGDLMKMNELTQRAFKNGYRR